MRSTRKVTRMWSTCPRLQAYLPAFAFRLQACPAHYCHSRSDCRPAPLTLAIHVQTTGLPHSLPVFIFRLQACPTRSRHSRSDCRPIQGVPCLVPPAALDKHQTSLDKCLADRWVVGSASILLTLLLDRHNVTYTVCRGHSTVSSCWCCFHFAAPASSCILQECGFGEPVSVICPECVSAYGGNPRE